MRGPARSGASRKELLAEAYGRSSSASVAFVDESYQDHKSQPGKPPFYIVTAVVVRKCDMASVRKSLAEIAAEGYWHTTEARRTQGGPQKIDAMVDYLAEGGKALVVAISRGFDAVTPIEDVRAECLRDVASSVADPKRHSVDLMILEERPGDKAKAIDASTISSARESGELPRELRLFQTSPWHESLLWLPDLAANVIRREMTHGDTVHSAKLAPITEYSYLGDVEQEDLAA